METIWLLALGFMLGGWFVLDGANLGLGMSLRAVGRTRGERRLVLTALGPFLLAGEVWLVASAGLLIGAFPALEKDVLYAFYPLIVGLVAVWILRDAGAWFRSRRPSARWRGGWERVVVLASGAFAFVWGLLLANVAQGVPHGGRPGVETLVGPYSLLWGVTMVAVLLLHGAAFTARRLPGPPRERALAIARPVATAVPVLIGAVVVASPIVGVELARPVPAVVTAALAVVACVAARRFIGRGDDARAFACTALLAPAALVAVGAGTAPRLAEGAAGGPTLELLAAVALPAIPVLVAVQAWMWWVFRHRVDSRSAVFF